MDLFGQQLKIKNKAVVKCFAKDRRGNYDACAYIDEPKTVVFIIINSRDRNGFENSWGAFKALVGSYEFFTDKVTIQK